MLHLCIGDEEVAFLGELLHFTEGGDLLVWNQLVVGAPAKYQQLLHTGGRLLDGAQRVHKAFGEQDVCVHIAIESTIDMPLCIQVHMPQDGHACTRCFWHWKNMPAMRVCELGEIQLASDGVKDQSDSWPQQLPVTDSVLVDVPFVWRVAEGREESD